MRKLLGVAFVVFLVWFFFIRPGSSEFGCEAAAGVAHAASDECPSSAEAAAGDAGWAADRYDAIKDEKVTTGLFYDEDGNEHELTSGEDADAEVATSVLQELGIVRSGATLNVATHVEVKAAAQMRENGVTRGVLVINRAAGVCSGARYGCEQVVPAVLDEEAVLTIWSPKEIAEGQPREFPGGG